MDITELPLHRVAGALRDGVFSAEDYAAELLARCHEFRDLNAFINLDPEATLGRARAADDDLARGRIRGLLHGVPLAIKDNIDVAGMITTAGTPALCEHRVSRTAPVANALFKAGAYPFAKTNLHELAFGITSNNECFGAVPNPYSRNKSAGGSSSGTAAAVAARLVPAGLGSDTAGSVRIPAAHCGIFGFRPSLGRYPAAGMVPLFHSRDTAGPMARSARDLALLDAVITGEDTMPAADLPGLRIGVPRALFGDLDRRTAAVIDAEIRRLVRLGVVLVAISGSELLDGLAEIAAPIRAWELPRDFEKYLHESGARVDFATVMSAIAGDYVRDEFDNALRDIDDPELAQRYDTVLSTLLPRYRAAYRELLAENNVDVIAFPTTPLAPTPLTDTRRTVVDGTERSVWDTFRNAIPASLAGAPGLSLPVGLTADGLPVGLELDALPGADRALLALGQAWQASADPLPAPATLGKPARA